MKKELLFLLFFPALFFAQVGIGTTTPRGALDVNGNILLDSYLILDETNFASGPTKEYYLLVRSEDSNPVGEVKLLDVLQRQVGPINKYAVRIDNVNQSSVISLNTDLDVSKYYLGLAEAVYTGVNASNQEASVIASTTSSTTRYGTYHTSVAANNSGKYTINLNFNNSNTVAGRNGSWEVSFVVFEKTMVKDWGTINGSVGSDYNGVSTTTPLGLQ